MINQVILAGKLERDFEVIEKDNKKYASGTLIVQKKYKNANGKYDIDTINFTSFAPDPDVPKEKNFIETCKKDDIIAIKGYLTSNNNRLFLNAEKITLISLSKSSEQIEQEKDIKI